MKRILFITGATLLVALFGCAPEEKPQVQQQAAPDASVNSDAPASTVLSMNYIDAASALAADDMEKAKASLTALARESTGELRTLAQTAADTGDIAAMRAAFKPLSAAATSLELPKDYAVAFCPMYKGGSKWVQKKDKLANPYFGKAMLTCGSFVN